MTIGKKDGWKQEHQRFVKLLGERLIGAMYFRVPSKNTGEPPVGIAVVVSRWEGGQRVVVATAKCKVRSQGTEVDVYKRGCSHTIAMGRALRAACYGRRDGSADTGKVNILRDPPQAPEKPTEFVQWGRTVAEGVVHGVRWPHSGGAAS